MKSSTILLGEIQDWIQRQISGGVRRNGGSDLVGRSYRNRAFVDDDLVAGQDVASSWATPRRNLNLRSIFIWRRWQSQKNDVRTVDRIVQVCCEFKSSGGDVSIEQGVQVGLVDGHLSILRNQTLVASMSTQTT